MFVDELMTWSAVDEMFVDELMTWSAVDEMFVDELARHRRFLRKRVQTLRRVLLTLQSQERKNFVG
jgi:hypothetical protein